MIKENHVLPGERFKADIVGVILDVLWNAGVVCSGGFNLECLRCQKAGKSDGSRRADLHLREALFLKVLEQLEKRRKTNLKPVVLREIEISSRCEYLQPS